MLYDSQIKNYIALKINHIFHIFFNFTTIKKIGKIYWKSNITSEMNYKANENREVSVNLLAQLLPRFEIDSGVD